MKKGNIGALVIAAMLLGFSANSHAIVIGPSDWISVGSDPANYLLTVDQVANTTGGQFDFNLSVVGTPTADLLGFYFNINDAAANYTPGPAFNSMTSTGDTISTCGFDIAASGCGGQNNLNGQITSIFSGWDVGLQIGGSGSSNGLNTNVSFSLDAQGYGLADFESFGIRANSVGAQGGSDKAYSFGGTPPTEVPEPASMALMGLGLVGLGLTRRKKKTS